MKVIPVLFCCLISIASATLVVPCNVLFAAPPEEKLPDLSKPKLHREETVLEKAVNQAAAMLLQGKLPPTEDGVRFALWLYGDKGDVAYLDIATKMARELMKSDAVVACTALYWVAEAGGPTLYEAKGESDEHEDAGITNGHQLLEWYARVRATRNPTVPRVSTGSGDLENLDNLILEQRTLMEQFQFTDDAVYESILLSLTTAELENFWDAEHKRFRDEDAPDSLIHGNSARAALAMWEAGVLTGNATFRNRAEQSLGSDLEAALQDPNAAAIAGLAAARMSRHPVQIAIIGNPSDSTVAALRQTAYFLFEPRKIILNLDPKTDSKRMAELMYPADAAPAMFVCVETLCSPPIKDPAELEKQVTEIKKLAAQVEQ